MTWTLFAQVLILMFLTGIFLGIFWVAYTKMCVKVAIIEWLSYELSEDEVAVQRLKKILGDYFEDDELQELLQEMYEAQLMVKKAS